MEDRISKLPDDMLISILSRLTIEEAARTSVLSSKWTNLWKFFNGRLEFIDPVHKKHLEMMRLKMTAHTARNFDFDINEKRLELANSIDQALRSLHGQTIEELKICFPIMYDCNVDRWVRFAINVSLQRLDLDFSNSVRISGLYHFPSDFDVNSSFRSLTSLSLTDVDISKEVVENLLCYCPLLEVLKLTGTESLTNLTISGPSVKLKYLELKKLPHFYGLEIASANLVSFVYCGNELNLCFRHVPSLAELCIEGEFGSNLVCNLHPISSFVTQLRTLKLHLMTSVMSADVISSIPELPNLKHLELSIITADGDCFLPCAVFLKASPSLYHFTVKMSCVGEPRRYVHSMKDYHNSNLRVVKFIGFHGSSADTEFLVDFLENFKRLEKIIIDPCRPHFMGFPVEWLYRKTGGYKSARRCGIELAAKFPDREFVVM